MRVFDHTKLVEARKKRGLRLEAVAGGLFVSLQTVRNWEAGRYNPGLDRLHGLMEFFGKPMDYFFKEIKD